MPMLTLFDSTVKELNESLWYPYKDNTYNRLVSSILGETPTLSNLLIDETEMNTGQIENRGVKNIQAIT